MATTKLSRRSSKPPPAGTIDLDPMITLQGILGTTDKDLSPGMGVSLSGVREGRNSLGAIATVETNTKDLKNDEQNIAQDIRKYEDLHDEIVKSDAQFEILQQYLSKFQSDLGALSTDMEQLQTRSVQLSDKLETRTQAESRLGPLVDTLVLSPVVVKQIVEGEISSQWNDALQRMTQQKQELEKLRPEYGNAKAFIETQEQMQLLTYKAVERIRDFIVFRIRSMRQRGVNAQSVQKVLLNYKHLFEFLKSENEPLADDLRQAYVNTMRWYYSSRFQRYIRSLEKLQTHTFDKTVLLGDDTGAKRGLFYRGGDSSHSNIPTDLGVGARPNIIASEDSSVMLAQIAETSTTPNYMETGYRSLNLALVDNCSVEYSFLSDFFQQSSAEGAITRVFQDIFTPTFTQAHAYTKTLIQDSFDCYGILICIRLAKRLEFETQHRKVPVMEDYLNLEMINLWPRFQSVMDSHCESLRRAATRSTSFAYAKNDSSGSSTGASSSVPHPITQQFASLLSGILNLCPNDDAASEPVANSVLRLRNDFESFLTKVSSAIKDQTNRERFLHHNYALVSTVLSTDLEGTLAIQQQEHFDLLMKAYTK